MNIALIDYVQELDNLLNYTSEKEKNAYKSLVFARKMYDSIQDDVAFELYENAFERAVYWADRVDEITAEIEAAGGVID